MGNASYPAASSAAGTPLPVFLDEVSPWSPGGAVHTVALPAGACTLARGAATSALLYIWHDTSGFPSTSADGKLVALQCWAIAPGGVISDATLKTVAVVAADGTVDVSTSTAFPTAGSSGSPIALHGVATTTGASFYAAVRRVTIPPVHLYIDSGVCVTWVCLFPPCVFSRAA